MLIGPFVKFEQLPLVILYRPCTRRSHYPSTLVILGQESMVNMICRKMSCRIDSNGKISLTNDTWCNDTGDIFILCDLRVFQSQAAFDTYIPMTLNQCASIDES